MRFRPFFQLMILIYLALSSSCGEPGRTVKSTDETETTTQSPSNEDASFQSDPDIPVTKVGEQIWMNNNLDVATFRNGDSILRARTAEEWMRAAEKEEPAWCYFENMNLEGRPTGKLYNWYAVNDPRGLAPEGWKIPSIEDLWEMFNYRGPDEGKLPVPPSSRRTPTGKFKKEGFGYSSMCWTDSESKNPGNANVVLFHALESSHPNYMSNPEGVSSPKGAGLAVRCLKIQKQ